ncbi:MAG: helix-turn-helix domain-containing protein [Oscillospiraceae bacterium]
MILADKIIDLRKKNGWSQEELAEKLGVSRQAVSKWEGAQSVPDIGKILQMSRIFGVTTDYLIKDELGEPEYTADDETKGQPMHKVSLADAQEFLAVKERTARPIAWATFMCILSPVCLIILTTAAEVGRIGISEDRAGAIGLCALFVLIAAATAIFISCGAKTERFEFLEKEVFETEYGVVGMVKQKKEQYQQTYSRYNIIGTVLCILSVIPLFIGTSISDDDFTSALMVALLFLLVATGVVFFIVAGITESAMKTLLQEGEYSVKQKKNTSRNLVAEIYWPIVTAVFLAYSFLTNGWGRSWIIWPVAGVLYAAIMAICNAMGKKEQP